MEGIKIFINKKQKNMDYLLLKDLPFAKAGTIFITEFSNPEYYNDSADGMGNRIRKQFVEDNKEWFQKIIDRPFRVESGIGLIGRLKKQQTDRGYFSNIPVGTLFIILEEHNNIPAYDITAYFLGIVPNKIDNRLHFTGYVEKGSWEVAGTINEYTKYLKQ